MTPVQIFGERCSGTNYLEHLLVSNFEVEIRWDNGFKHWPVVNSYDPTTSYFCISRNLDDWVGSMLKHRHHIPPGIKDPLTQPFINVNNRLAGPQVPLTLLEHRYIFMERVSHIPFMTQWLDYDWLRTHTLEWLHSLPLTRRSRFPSLSLTVVNPGLRVTREPFRSHVYPRLARLAQVQPHWEQWMDGKTEKG